MAIAFVACIVSILQTSVARTEPCPLCGRPMEHIGTIQNLSMDRSTSRAHSVHRCHRCDYEIVLPGAQPHAIK